MVNLTVTIDEVVLKRARQRAIAEGTSVSALVREHLRHYAREGTGFEGFLALSEQLDAAADARPDAG